MAYLHRCGLAALPPGQTPGSTNAAPHIGNREVVGYGYNGMETYADTFQAPFPAIRFKEETPEIAKIIAKEKGDWKKMTLEEKKALYEKLFERSGDFTLEAPG